MAANVLIYYLLMRTLPAHGDLARPRGICPRLCGDDRGRPGDGTRSRAGAPIPVRDLLLPLVGRAPRHRIGVDHATNLPSLGGWWRTLGHRGRGARRPEHHWLLRRRPRLGARQPCRVRSRGTFLNLPRQNQYCVLNYDSAPDDCLRFYRPLQRGELDMRILGKTLESLHMGVFYGHRQLRLSEMTKRPERTLYSIESVGGEKTSLYCVDPINCGAFDDPAPIVIPYGATIDVSGWAVDATAHSAAAGVFISIDGGTNASVAYGGGPTVLAAYGGTTYPGVAAFFKNAAYLNSGFKVAAPSRNLAIGRHLLTIQIVAHDGATYFEPPVVIPIELRSCVISRCALQRRGTTSRP